MDKIKVRITVVRYVIMSKYYMITKVLETVSERFETKISYLVIFASLSFSLASLTLSTR
jgi:hypothetical protein